MENIVLWGDLHDFLSLLALFVRDPSAIGEVMRSFYDLLAPKWSRHGIFLEQEAETELKKLGLSLSGPVMLAMRLLSFSFGSLLQELHLYSLPCTE